MSKEKERAWYTDKELVAMYGKYWQRILGSFLEEKEGREKGQRHKWAFKGEIPTKEEYEKRVRSTFKVTVQGCIEEATGLVEEIANGLEEWAGNMPENFADKKSEIEDALSTVQDAQSSMENISIPEAAGNREFVNYPYEYPIFRGRQNTSRPQMNSHAISLLEAAKGELEEAVGELDERISAIDEAEENPVAVEAVANGTADPDAVVTEDRDELESEKEEIEQAVQEIEEAISNLEGIDFPRAR